MKNYVICAVVYSDTIDGLKNQAVRAKNAGVHIIEYRVDGIQDLDIEEFGRMIKLVNLPSIVSSRSEWNNEAITAPKLGREELIRRLLTVEPDFINLEYPIDIPILSQINGKTKIVLSMLDFDGMSKIDFRSVKEYAQNDERILVKISATPNSVNNLRQLWKWGYELKKDKIDHVVLGMGELGKLSRIKSLELGNAWMYGRVDSKNGEPYLPGMLDISLLQKAFDDESWHLASIGKLNNYFTHELYNRILSSSEVDGVFLDVPITMQPELDQLLLWISDGLLDGLLVNEPWRKDVVPILNYLDASVIHVGEANTIALTKEGLTGYNTQVEGVRRVLSAYSMKRLKRIYIEGTDLYARSVIAAVREFAELIVVRGIREEPLVELKTNFPEIELAQNSFTDHFDLIVSSNLPQQGFEKIDPVPPKFMKNAKLVFDILNLSNEPSPTIETAQRLNIPFITGKEFAINTALASFEIWTKQAISPSVISVEDLL